MIPNHLLWPPEPAAGQQGSDDNLSSAAEDEADWHTAHPNAIAAGNVAASFRTTFGPGAAEAAASFREMLKATRTGQRRAAPARPTVKTNPGGQALAVAQGLPTLPVARPIDTTDIDLPRIVVEGGSSDGPSGEPAAPRVAVPHHMAPAQAGADGGVGSGDGPGPVGSLSGPVDPERWAGTGAAAGGFAGVAVGGEVGAVAGAAAGAAGGTLVVPGVGTVGGAVVGAVAGAAEGAAVAGAAGAVVGGEAGKLAGEFVNYMKGGDGSRATQGEATDGKNLRSIEEGKQGKHIEGHNNYDPERSTLTADPQELADQHAGQGQPANSVPRGQPGFKERFDAGKTIGTYRNPGGDSMPTNKGIIVYSKHGIHIYPVRP